MAGWCDAQQRLCFAVDGDLFAAIRADKAAIVTDEIGTFTETGLRLRSGEQLDADIVVTATGLDIKVAGGIELMVDSEVIDLAKDMLIIIVSDREPVSR